MRYSLPGFLLILAGLGLVGLTQTVNSSTTLLTEPVVTLPSLPIWPGPVVWEIRETAKARRSEEAQNLLPASRPTASSLHLTTPSPTGHEAQSRPCTLKTCYTF
jgi:hypothetical protein